MTVTLADFAFAVRPTIANTDITGNAGFYLSQNFTAGVAAAGGRLSFYRPAAIGPDLGTEYTIVVVLDPDQAESGYRTLLSLAPYGFDVNVHSAPYADLSMVTNGGSSAMLICHSIDATNLVAVSSGSGFVNTASDGQTCYAARRDGNTVEFVLNGVLYSTASGAGTTAPRFNPDPAKATITIGSRSDGSPGEGCAGTYYFVGIANRWLTDDELAAITADPLGFEGGSPQTWAGSSGTLLVSGSSGTFTPGAVSWTGSAGTVTITGTSGVFTPGASTWAGSTGTLTVTGTSGVFTPGASTWAGSTGTLTVTGTSGGFTPGAATWAGSTGTITIAGVSGEFSNDAPSQTWAGSTGTLTVAGTSGLFSPGTGAWSGSTGSVILTGTSGSFIAGGATWAGSAGTLTVSGTSGTFTPGAVTWAGSAGSLTLTGTSGLFTPGDVAWLGSIGVMAVTGVSGLFLTESTLPTGRPSTRVPRRCILTLVTTPEARTR